MQQKHHRQGQKLDRSFYVRDDVTAISRELLGKYLCTSFDGEPVTSGMIVETEAYTADGDKACHAYDGRRTDRTEIMFRRGGLAYVYLCYGIHHLFNVVTNVKGKADAILVRAVKPVDGLERMLQRRGREKLNRQVAGGPGMLTQALGIKTDHYGTDLTGSKIWIEDRGTEIDREQITAGPRVGVDYAGEDALLPWRFRLTEGRWTSKPD